MTTLTKTINSMAYELEMSKLNKLVNIPIDFLDSADMDKLKNLELLLSARYKQPKMSNDYKKAEQNLMRINALEQITDIIENDPQFVSLMAYWCIEIIQKFAQEAEINT